MTREERAESDRGLARGCVEGAAFVVTTFGAAYALITYLSVDWGLVYVYLVIVLGLIVGGAAGGVYSHVE